MEGGNGNGIGNGNGNGSGSGIGNGNGNGNGNGSGIGNGNGNGNGNQGDVNRNRMALHAGFRFHPLDEELVTFYLVGKVRDINFFALAVADVDFNKVEPWDLPGYPTNPCNHFVLDEGVAKMGEDEWFFFSLRDKKYPTGVRTNRSTTAGYWKATGKDKEIAQQQVIIGMKKTLVFYRGRAPRGEKTNWIMHEYRLEGDYFVKDIPIAERNDWVICRVFQKNTCENNTQSFPGPDSLMLSNMPTENVPYVSDSAGTSSNPAVNQPLNPYISDSAGTSSNPAVNQPLNPYYPVPNWPEMQSSNLILPPSTNCPVRAQIVSAIICVT